jgi:hypothetical protein
MTANVPTCAQIRAFGSQQDTGLTADERLEMALGERKPNQLRDTVHAQAVPADDHGVGATPPALDSSVTARRHNGGHGTTHRNTTAA